MRPGKGTTPTTEGRGVSLQQYWAQTWRFSRQHQPPAASPRHLQRKDWQLHQGCIQLAERPQRWGGCWMLKKWQSQPPAPDSPPCKWSESPAPQRHMHRGLRVQHTCLHLNWQRLKPSLHTYLLSVNDGSEILRGKDTDPQHAMTYKQTIQYQYNININTNNQNKQSRQSKTIIKTTRQK